MKWFDVIIFQIDFDERLPVVIAFVNLNVIQHVAGKVEIFGDAELPPCAP
jgi:hypothetical protein